MDAKSSHGFASSKPVQMWNSKTLAPIKTIEIDAKASPDGKAGARAAFAALPFNDKGPLRVYLMSLRRVPRVVVP